jgi:hypothetical protein
MSCNYSSAGLWGSRALGLHVLEKVFRGLRPPWDPLSVLGRTGDLGALAQTWAWGVYTPLPPRTSIPPAKICWGVWQFFLRSKKLFGETGDLFFFARRRRNFWELGGIYPPPPQRKKRAHVWDKCTFSSGPNLQFSTEAKPVKCICPNVNQNQSL